ncbi:phospholipase A [Muribaculum intestinale]|uniref:phospholipase A n=2 Tax=Muribaculum intestinale TaxID=1796646 RepID=UPI00241C90AD|nr:phospholipase A [Muribaculum intestinale]
MPRRLLHTVYILFLLVISGMQSADAQIISPSKEDVLNVDSVKQAFEDAPYFSLYKDNYFIFGPSIGPRPTRTNTNVKFQISVAQRLTRSTLPGGSYLYLFYTQKCFWNVLEKSFPMTDLNFNPGIGITRPIFVKNRFIGKITLVLEHESNGRDSIQSRSWNKISLAANMLIDPKIMIYGKFWIPFIDGQNNRDLLDYVGIYQFGLSYMPFNHRFAATLLVTKRKGWNFNYNTMFEMSYKIGRRTNQYLFLQYYNGYGEGLLDYKQFKSQLRVGFVIRPRFFSDY